MPNENVVVKIGMDKPFFFFFFCLQYHLGGLFASLSLASVSHGQLEAVLCGKGSSCPEDECDEQVDCGPGSTKTHPFSTHSWKDFCLKFCL